MKTATLNIEGMHCDGCAQSIKALVEREEGVKAADVSCKNAQRPPSRRSGSFGCRDHEAGYRVIGLVRAVREFAFAAMTESRPQGSHGRIHPTARDTARGPRQKRDFDERRAIQF